ncbi:MAG: DUF502 domain-containing protein [Candidatus Omnitrophota bacterium]
MFIKLRKDFFTGLVVILPLVLTISIFTFLAKAINEKVLTPVMRLLGLHFYDAYWIYGVKFLAFLLTILLIAAIGEGTRWLILRRVFGFWEEAFYKVPIIGKVYMGIKEISRFFFSQGKQAFEKVVLIEYPHPGMYSLAFITQGANAEIRKRAGDDAMYVFLPTTPNPTSGFFLVVPKKDIIFLDMPVAEGLKLIISGGIISPESKT